MNEALIVSKLHDLREEWWQEGKKLYERYNQLECELRSTAAEGQKTHLRLEAYRNKHNSELCEDFCADLDQLIAEIISK